MVKQRVAILGIPIDPVTRAEALERIAAMIDSRLPHQIATVNPEFVMASVRQPVFRTALQHAELNVPDGAGILGAAAFLSLRRPRWQPAATLVGLVQGLFIGVCLLLKLPPVRKPVPETVPGIDLIASMSQRAAVQGWRLYLVGGDPGVAEAAAVQLRARYPALNIVSAEEGLPRGAVITPDATAALVNRIAAAQPDILLVAFGAPKQDLFIAEHKQELGVPVMMGVGGSFDFITGRARRSPVWLQTLGLEWVWRLLMEPWRLQRILTAALQFPWYVYRDSIDA